MKPLSAIGMLVICGIAAVVLLYDLKFILPQTKPLPSPTPSPKIETFTASQGKKFFNDGFLAGSCKMMDADQFLGTPEYMDHVEENTRWWKKMSEYLDKGDMESYNKAMTYEWRVLNNDIEEKEKQENEKKEMKFSL